MTALAPLGIHDFTPGVSFALAPGLKGFADNFWKRHGIRMSRPILMVNVRTTWPDKNWRPEFFGIALKNLPESIQIVFCGAKEDSPYIETARKHLGRQALSIAGKTSLTELAALFRSATLLLTGDTGPLYIAEAVGLPTLSLWGRHIRTSTDP